jgi:hypothetical protein
MRRLLAFGAAAFVLILLVIAQLVLPGIASQRLRDRLSRSGEVLEVKVSAFPAIELLWHKADHVVIRMASYRTTPGNLGSLIAQAGDTGSLDASAAVLDSGLLKLRNAALRKRGNALTGSANVGEADIKQALPILQSVQPVLSSGGQLVLRGTATVLGVTATADATVSAVDGRLQVTPDVPFGGLATLTLFADPHVYVNGITARATTNGFAVSGTASLR